LFEKIGDSSKGMPLLACCRKHISSLSWLLGTYSSILIFPKLCLP
jgi:hypothetical protein